MLYEVLTWIQKDVKKSQLGYLYENLLCTHSPQTRTEFFFPFLSKCSVSSLSPVHNFLSSYSDKETTKHRNIFWCSLLNACLYQRFFKTFPMRYLYHRLHKNICKPAVLKLSIAARLYHTFIQTCKFLL